MNKRLLSIKQQILKECSIFNLEESEEEEFFNLLNEINKDYPGFIFEINKKAREYFATNMTFNGKSIRFQYKGEIK